ncbi:SIMPL domain-containing protein [Actinomadura scrupuli]|uniref:SIMPL domain-containing protein n=1 Tax=Actinomadura scrupuli TaxID=559629 RepID=UPI003D99CA11
MSDDPLIRVRGETVLQVEPEIAELTVHLQARDMDRRRTLDRLSARNQQCLDLIKTYGEAVERLETTGLVVQPVMRERRRDEKVHRYQGTVRIHVTLTDFGVLGELVTRLGDLELTAVQGPTWALRPDSPVYRRARHQAAREAVGRAREYAEALGCRLTGLVELADEGLTTHPQREGYALAAAGDLMRAQSAPEPIDLEPETQTVRAAVEASFTATAPDDL